MAKLSFREFQAEDLPAAIRLIRENFNPDYSPEWWHWLYGGEANLGSRVLLAESEGRVVGKLGMIRKKFFYNGDTLTCGRLLDPVVDKSMRGRGVFTKMLAAIREYSQADFSYAFPNAGSLPGFLKAGFTYLGPITMPKCQLKFIHAPAKEMLRYFYTGAKVALNRNGSRVREASFDLLRDLTPSPPQDRFYLARDYGYLKWRYKSCPQKNYRLLVAGEGEEIRNACVVAEKDHRVSIVDLVTYSAPIHLPDYLAAIKRLYDKEAVSIWDCSLEDVSQYFFGKSVQNFVVLPQQPRIAEKVINLKRWYLTKGEIENS